MTEHTSRFCAFSPNWPHVPRSPEVVLGEKSPLSAFPRGQGPRGHGATGPWQQVLLGHGTHRCASVPRGPLSAEIIHNKSQMSPNRAPLGGQRKLGHNLSLETCRSCTIRCSHGKQMGSGRAAALTVPAKSNFLSFNEGWGGHLIKCPLITGLFLCVWPGGRQRKCVCG